jgi:HK97 gp10 family phage protein
VQGGDVMPIELTGMEGMLANLNKISNNVKAVKGKALKAGAEVIRKGIVARASFTKGYSKGAVAKNIVVSEVKTENVEEYIEVGPSKEVFYARMLEFGTVKMQAQPFVEPAAIEKREAALDAMANVIRGAIEDVQR